ncbi:MAG: Calx-beta domain-containing protein [Gammaproteobacteria bacterium]
MRINPKNDFGAESKVIQTELNANWFDSMTQHANADALKNIKIVMLQNLGEEAIEKAEDSNRLEPANTGEETPSTGGRSNLELIEFGRRGEVESQFRTLSMIATVFKDIKESIFNSDRSSETSHEKNETQPTLTIINIEIEPILNAIKITLKLDGVINQPINLHYEMQAPNELLGQSLPEAGTISEIATFYPTNEPIQILTINLPVSIAALPNLTEAIIIQIDVPNNIILNQLPAPLVENSISHDLAPEIPVKVSIEDIEVPENNTAILLIRLDKPASSLITIEFTTSSGTAITGGSGLLGEDDFTANAGTVTILPGQTQATLNIQIVDDEIYENHEYFKVEFTSIHGGHGATLETREALVTILDNDDDSPIAVGNEHTMDEINPEGEESLISGNLFEHDYPGNHGGSVSAIKFTFQDASGAAQYVSAHPELIGAQANSNIVKIPIPNAIISTPLGGTIHVEANGHYSYSAPSQGVSTDSDDIISYVLTDLDGDSAEASLIFHITDEVPHATDDTGYIAKPLHSYNLLLAIDVSGSMNDLINGQTRLSIAKNALVELIKNYDSIADALQITIIPFASGNGNDGAFSYTAKNVDDAIEFITNQGNHKDDGLAIGMLNPLTNQFLKAGTEYNDALYHARDQLELDLQDKILQNYESRVYFLSDGKPNSGHTAIDTKNWPSEWSSWQDYINKINIQTYAISIAAGTGVTQALEPIANQRDEVIDVNPDLSNLSTLMLDTVPTLPLSDNVLTNDMLADIGGGRITEIAFETPNADLFIEINHLNLLGAFSNKDGKTVHIPIPEDDSISFTTPLGSTFKIDSSGNYHYDAKPVGQDEVETFTYTIQENNSTQTSQATLTINILNDSRDLHELTGDHSDNTISSENLQGIIVMSGKEGDNNFFIDASEDARGNVIVIKDLSLNPENTLSFIHTNDTDRNGVLELADIIYGVTQNGENADVIVTLNNGTTPDHSDGTRIVFENIGTLPSNDVASLQSHLEQITAQLNVIN